LTYIDEDLLDRANDPSDPLYGTVHPSSGLCTSYVSFDCSQSPFDDPLVRRAFALAIDKERYRDVITEGRGVIARGLFPPGLPGYNQDVVPLEYDPEGAREALRASSYGGPSELPEIVMTNPGLGGDIWPSTALLLEMWEDTLGVTVTVEQLDPDRYADEIFAGNRGELVTWGWCADYPDPENFADLLFHSGSQQNIGRYSNPDLDALLEQARSEEDVEKRIALYQQIEQMIVDDAAVAFTTHSSTYYLLTKPYLHGYVSAPVGVAQNMNLSIEN
jgi:oligopeptide transport system substrate-binding protein